MRQTVAGDETGDLVTALWVAGDKDQAQLGDALQQLAMRFQHSLLLARVG